MTEACWGRAAYMEGGYPKENFSPFMSKLLTLVLLSSYQLFASENVGPDSLEDPDFKVKSQIISHRIILHYVTLHRGKIPSKREWQPTLVFLLGEFQGQMSLMGYSPWDHKELATTEQRTLSLRDFREQIYGCP